MRRILEDRLCGADKAPGSARNVLVGEARHSNNTVRQLMQAALIFKGSASAAHRGRPWNGVPFESSIGLQLSCHSSNDNR